MRALDAPQRYPKEVQGGNKTGTGNHSQGGRVDASMFQVGGQMEKTSGS